MKYFNNFFIALAVAVMAVYGFTGCGSDETKTVTTSSWDGASCNPTATGGKVLPSSIVAPDIDSPSDGDTSTISNGDTITYVAADAIWEYDVTESCVGISGATQVGKDMRIKFAAGATVVADASQLSYLSIKRNGQIEAIGTSTNPIVFTSANAVGSRTASDWGGIIIHGNAATNTVSNSNYSDETEIQTGSYGCTETIADTSLCAQTESSGTLQYVRVEFAGYEISSGKEFNGIFLAGVGSGTTIDHVQVHRGSDDGIEIFGGTVNLDHIVITYNDDDGFDLDDGWSGTASHFVIAKGTDIGDCAIEYDGLGKDEDRVTQSFFSNFTVLGQGTSDKKKIVDVKKNGHLVIVNSYFGNFTGQTMVRQDEVDPEAANTNFFASTYASNAITGFTATNDFVSGLAGNLFELITVDSAVADSIDDILSNDTTGSATAGGLANWGDADNTSIVGNENSFSPSLTLYTAPTDYWGEGGASDFMPSSVPTTNVYASAITGYNNIVLTPGAYIGAFSSTSDTWMDGWTTNVQN
jgi:hypothetical protein